MSNRTISDSWDPKPGLLASWLEHTRRFYPAYGNPRPMPMTRVHVLDMPDNVRCTMDGVVWGVLQTSMAPRTVSGPGEYPVRCFVADGVEVETASDREWQSGRLEMLTIGTHPYVLVEGSWPRATPAEGG